MVEGHQQGLSDVKPFPFLVEVSVARPEDPKVQPEAAATQPEDLMVLPEAAEVLEQVVLAVVVSPQLRDTAVLHAHSADACGGRSSGDLFPIL